MTGLAFRASKVITDHDRYLARYFPCASIYPGRFVIETLRQAASDALGVDCELVSVRSARSLMPLVCGDVVVLEAALGPVVGDGAFLVTATAAIQHADIPAATVQLFLRAAGLGAVAVAA